MMKKEDYFRIVDQICESGGLSIFLTGGEVLTHPNFIEMYLYAKNKGMFVSILSNATILTEDVADILSDYPPALFSTTMYGATADTYESITQIPGSFEMFIDSIEMLKDRNIKTEIKAILLQSNKQDIMQIREYSITRGMSFRFSASIRPTENGSIAPLSYALSPEEVFEFDKIIPEQYNYYLRESVDPMPQPETDRKRRENYTYLCSFAENAYFITCSLMLYGCPRERCHGEDLSITSFREGWETLGVLKEKRLDLKTPCHTCNFFRYCRQCSAEMECRGDISKPIEETCLLARYRYNFVQSLRNMD